jgi:hypothetical protein
MLFSNMHAEQVDQLAVLDTRRAGGYTAEAAQAAVDVRQSVIQGKLFFQDRFHQDDPAPGRIHFFS